MLFLLVACVLSYLFGNGDRFIGLHLHPFWIIVLLMSSIYGTVEGIFAAVASTIVLYFRNLPPMQTNQDLFQYQFEVSMLPMLWVIAAYVLGEIRLGTLTKMKQLKEESLHTDSKAERIAAEYSSLKEQNQNLALSLTSKEETAASAFQVFKELENLEPARVIVGVDPIVRLSLRPTKFPVYAMGTNGFEAVTSEGWLETDKYNRRITTESSLFQVLMKEKRLITVINKNDQKILGEEGILAAPLIDPESDEIFGMIKVEEIPFENLNLIRLETFKTVCELIGKSYANSKKHKEMLDSSLYNAEGTLLSNTFYETVSEYLKQLGKEQGFVLTDFQLQMKPSGQSLIDLDKLKKNLPPLSLVFQGKKRNEIRILIPSAKSKPPLKINDALSAAHLADEQFHLSGSIHD
jgi:hypothetical protein